jgi:hypothetical protein
MEGHSLNRRRTPQLIRSFAPTRLSADLLAGVYERLLAVGVQGTDTVGSQDQIMAWELEVPLGEDHAVMTGGR